MDNFLANSIMHLQSIHDCLWDFGAQVSCQWFLLRKNSNFRSWPKLGYPGIFKMSAPLTKVVLQFARWFYAVFNVFCLSILTWLDWINTSIFSCPKKYKNVGVMPQIRPKKGNSWSFFSRPPMPHSLVHPQYTAAAIYCRHAVYCRTWRENVRQYTAGRQYTAAYWQKFDDTLQHI